LRVAEAAPVAFLVVLCIVIGTASSPVMRYLEHAANSLHEPQDYIRTVLTNGDGAAP
jgi:multicomponent K+:H+ antiporter subunit D